MTIKLKPYQRERIARGPLIKYQGPMSEFSKFLESDPAKKTVYNNAIAQIDQKMLLKMYGGGVLKGSVGLYTGNLVQKTKEIAKKGAEALTPTLKEEMKESVLDKVDQGKEAILTAPKLDESAYTSYEPEYRDFIEKNKTKTKPASVKDTEVDMTPVRDTEVDMTPVNKAISNAVEKDTEVDMTPVKDTDVKSTETERQEIAQELLGRKFKAGEGGGLEYYKDFTPKQIRSMVGASDEAKAYAAKKDKEKPTKPEAEKVDIVKVDDKTDPRQEVKFDPVTDVETVTAKQTTPTTDITTPDPRDAETVTTEKVADKTRTELKDLTAATGQVTDKALVQAQTVDAAASAIKNVNAAQIDKAQQIDNIPKRKVAAEELVSGSAVKSAEIEQNLEKFQAAQLDLDPMATTQGQLNKLLQDFDAGSPPPWAAAGMRAANAVLNQRGLGASSIAGQAIIQAQMESAIPIAQSDAQVVFNLGIQNLSNRQQRAVLAAQQRAQFLGQEFDQEFQTRVTNAARISDVANQNFNAEVQVTLENARMAQSVDLANLNNRQALIMADAAQIANLEMANLNNRQQAAVQNAQAFLQMDMANLQYKQQTQLFKAQEQIKAMFTDSAAENAAAQFNASSQNQVNQFYDSLANETKRFNVQQKNAMEQFNVSQQNSIAQFNAQQENAIAQFNASNGLVVSQANAQWRQQIATIDTAAENQVNQFNAQSAMQLTVREYEGMWQDYRDKMHHAHNTAESALDRQNQYAIAIMNKEAQIEAAKFGMQGQMYAALGGLAASMAEGSDFFGAIKSLIPGFKDKGKGGGGEGKTKDDGIFTDAEKLEFTNYQDVMNDPEYADITGEYDLTALDTTYTDEQLGYDDPTTPDDEATSDYSSFTGG